VAGCLSAPDPNALVGKTEAKISRAEDLEKTKLSSIYSEDWNLKPCKDEKLGIAVIVVENKRNEMSWSSSSSEIRDNPFAKSDTTDKWTKQENQSPDGTITVYLKKCDSTYKAVIENRSANLFLRYIALRDMDELTFTPDQKLDFLKFCAADPSATIRVMAMQKANDYKPLEKVIPFCCRALTDPCLMVADGALTPLVKYFHIKSPDGKNEYDTSFTFSGSPEAFDRMLKNRILYISQQIHKVRPDLVTDDDLEQQK
jgi:hypothetical protein